MGAVVNPTIAVLVVNVAAVGVAIGKAATWGLFTEQAQHAMLGMVFNVWILVLLYPFALGIMGQWGKKPAILFILQLMSICSVAIMYITFRVPYTLQTGQKLQLLLVKRN